MARLISGSLGGGGGTGDVVGPASASDNALARFDATTGKLIQNSTATLDDLGELATASLSTNGHHALQVKPYGSGAGQTGEVSFHELSGGNYVGFRAPDSIGADVIWTLPAADGSANQVLGTNGAGVLSWRTDAGITKFTESEATAAPNATVYVDALTAAGSTAAVDVAIVPKGTGALLAQIPDSAIAAGNKRGANATDWQRSRTAAANVASGTDATISGGADNQAAAQGATVAGGATNAVAASRNYATISGGQSNTIYTGGTHGTISGGQTNSIQAAHGFIGGGQGNSQSSAGTHCVIAGGNTNTTGATMSVIGGGQNNTSALSGNYATIGGGLGNVINASAQAVAIAGGRANTGGASYAAIGGGYLNDATGQYSGVFSGSDCNATANYATIGGGVLNTAGGIGAFVGSGESNNAGMQYSCIPGGYWGYTNYYAEIAHASGRFAAAGDAQASEVVLRRSITVGAAATDLTIDGAAPPTSNTLSMGSSSAYQFRISVIARDTGATGQYAFWNVVGGISRDAASSTTALIGSLTTDSGNSGGSAAGWTCVVQANTASGYLQILVSAPAGTGPVRFVATAHLTRVA